MTPLTSSLLLLSLLTSRLEAIPVLEKTPAHPAHPAHTAHPSPGVRILRAPESLVAPLGDEVVLECETSLQPERFEWTHRASKSPGAGFKYFRTGTAKANVTQEAAISRLTILVRPDTLGEYRCIGWFGPLVVTSTTARLELASISLMGGQESESPLQWRVTAGNSVLWSCGQQVQSNPSASWSYYRNGVEIKPEFAGTNGNLFLSNVSSESSGNYSCQATNPASGERIQLVGSLQLQVTPIQRSQSKSPHLLKGQPSSQVITSREGSSVLLLCPGVGSPPPTVVWSSPDVAGAVKNKRSKVSGHALEIANIGVQDAGTYICFQDNGVRHALEHYIHVRVEQPPQIVRSPWTNITNEGEHLQLDCEATGVPAPQIYWLLNGHSSLDDTEAELSTNSLVLHSVLKRHAGYVQCFARNTLGEDSAGTLLEVNAKQIQEPRESGGTHRPKSNQGTKLKQMFPPSPPNVTRLTDESVMLRWMVPRNDGLPIVIFKVQYRMVGKRKSWQTTNDNIPYGKPKWNSEAGKSFTASVTDLKPEHTYRFRILAIYSNNDNKESNTSAKFYLQPGAALDPMPVPELLEIEEYSETAVVLHWSLASDADERLITGYYAYYRPSSSAGEYFKATIEGAQARSFKIAPLETATIYEFKLQSFSSVSASEFSALKQGRTQRPKTSTTEEPTQQMGDSTTPSHNETFSMSPMLTGTIGGGAVLMLLLISTCLCVCRRRNSRGRGNNPNKPRMAELRDDFVPLGNCSPTKQRQRTRHIHITLNPLAQQQQQAMEEKNDTDQDTAYYQRPSNYDYDPGLRRMSSSSLRRSQRTLERAGGSNGSSNGNNNNLNQSAEAGLVDNPGKPGRVLIKRPRLSSRSENLSSGSLNSVGV
ncbi:interference hedgehog [Drosophila subpulchrella]|uniref:interference hedgehog n=1 Tax=Drosophila subpulchrella TaxID=1486046 RepID=UPI0018A18B8A|nr:interference hedgehog [Drosophila subpulchrella]XP_037711044.1 interference hedgehog [Drosophila subpulchrella]